MTDSVTQDQMAPEASPGEVTKKSGVRRLNNLPMYIVGVGLTLFLVIIGLVASNRAAQQNIQATEQKEKGGDAGKFASEITGEQKGGLIPAETPKPNKLSGPATSASAVPIAGQDSLEAPPPPPISASGALPRNEEMDRIRMVKMQQLEEAVKAKTTVQVVAARSPGSTLGSSTYAGAPGSRDEALARLAAVRQQIDSAGRDDPTAAYKARLAQLQSPSVGAAGTGSGAGTAPQLIQATAAGTNNVAQFSNSGQGDRWKLDSQPEAPRTPYELRAGFVVPATLISGINSELPGQIMAQVSQNVYDTPTGKHKLIPQGSRLVGAYSSNVAYGQARVLIAWQRIVFPDGKAMDIGSMPGADSAGYAGLSDQVNNHYFRLFASAFLMSGVTAGISLSQPNKTTGTTSQTASGAISEALGQQLGQVTTQLIAKNMNISPTLEIRPGYRFNVMVTKDMTFSKPYRAFDY